MTVWAKKRKKDGVKQDLNEHTQWVIEEVMGFIKGNPGLHLFIAERCGFTEERLMELAFYVAYFHDGGKNTVQFGRTIDSGYRSFHSLYSAAIFPEMAELTQNDAEKILLELLVLVILTHHCPYYEHIFSGAKYKKNYEFSFLPDSKTFFDNYRKAYENVFQKPCPHSFRYVERDLGELSYLIDYGWPGYIREITEEKRNEALRFLYCYLLGVLNFGDWMASARFNGVKPTIVFNLLPNQDYLYLQLKKALKVEEFIPRNFQTKMGLVKGNVLVEIPTGEGKTEGSYLWAVSNIKNIYSKIIYTLPTQTTSNKLYERAVAVFENQTGLLHSSSETYLQQREVESKKETEILQDIQSDEESGLVNDLFQSEMLFTRVFAKPFTVSTIDSLLKYFINVGRFSPALVNILNSAVIIDEVHAYDLKLLGFIKRFLELAEEYHIAVCIMSASIPAKVKELLGFKNFVHITDESLFEKKANRIVKVDRKLNEDIDLIINEYRKGKSILVVCNTVKQATAIYHSLKKDADSMLYHSQFKKKDRAKKEKEIDEKIKGNERFVLIATQVVEISLDINFDVMFTEIAPIDALIQRFGRVNRKKLLERQGVIYIYNQTAIKPYERKLLELSYQAITEGIYPVGEYRKWLDAVYNEYFKLMFMENQMSLFDEGYKVFDRIMHETEAIRRFSGGYDLRYIEYSKKDFLLWDDYCKGEISFENTISLGSWLAKSKFSQPSGNSGIIYDVLDLGYSYETGVLIQDEKEYGFCD